MVEKRTNLYLKNSNFSAIPDTNVYLAWRLESQNVEIRRERGVRFGNYCVDLICFDQARSPHMICRRILCVLYVFPEGLIAFLSTP